MSKPAPPASTSVPYAATLRVKDACLCLHAQRAARVLARRFDRALAAVQLTNSQFSLMMALNRPAPPSLGAVADLLAADRTTLTAALKPLQRRGLVTVSVDPRDRRSRLAALTESGRALLARALPIWEREHAAIEGELPLDAGSLRAGLLAIAERPRRNAA